ncbi:MAG: hypothetical protein IJX80_07350 [Clostridia bacterium]|nr:hypothetical protein [Clostridia bacterium]
MKHTDTWQKPKTTKVYLQMPLSERLALLCPDFKILNLPLLDDGTHVGQPGVGMILLHGDRMEAFDLDKTAFAPVTGGIPIYRVQNRAECLTSLEAFCGAGRNPTVYFKVTLKNDTDVPVESSIGMMPRSGQEKYMLNQHQEGYSPYRPNYKNWFMLKRTWKQTDAHTAASDMGYLTLRSENTGLHWIADSESGHQFAACDYFRVDYRLEPGEEQTIIGALRAKEAIADLDYGAQHTAALRFWEAQKCKIKLHPDTTDARMLSVFYHVAAQCTQMLAHYEGSDLVTARQGDVGRFIWPYEGAQVLIMLDRLGLSEHTGAAYRCYCERWFVSEGEDRGMIKSHAGWGNFTGSVIWGISEHLKCVNDQAEFDYFLPYLLAMRDWIERKRCEPREIGYEKIFPVSRGSDWGDHAQFWTFTDSHNAMAYRSMYEMLELYGHAEAQTTKELYTDYRDTLLNIRNELHAGHERDNAYILPHELGIPFEDTENYSYYTDGAPYLLYTGFIEPGSLIHRQMEAFFRSRGQFERGLTGRMTSCSSMWDEAYFGGYGDVWYTMQSETYWLKSWMATGETDKARETLDAMLTYGMTEEYIVAERYCSINPWYSPWQPNGSGSARMIEMLLAFFGEKHV